MRARRAASLILLALLITLAQTLPIIAAPLPASGRWVAGTPPIGLHPVNQAILLADWTILTYGLRYDPAADTWQPFTAPSEVNALNPIRLADGRVLIAGGTGGDGSFYGSREAIYDAITDQWTFVATMPTRRINFVATLLADGTVLVAGGVTPAGAIAAAERYNPATDTWAPAGSMATPRTGQDATATLLADGRVLVAGGGGGPDRIAAAEIYDPATNTWAATTPMREPRGGHTATLLPGGRMLVIGGLWAGNTSTTTVERYDPTTATWAAVAPLPAPRTGHTATTLADGTILVTGGSVEGGFTAAVERYDPAADRWLPTYGMRGRSMGRGNAVFLPDGSVVVLNDETTERFYPTAPTPAFADVSPNAAGYEAVTQLAGRDIVRGYGDGRFGPGDTLLRAQAAGIVARGLGFEIGGYSERFPDRGATDAELWRRVTILGERQIARGYEDGTFNPGGPVLKIQVISLIARAHRSGNYWYNRPYDDTVYPNVAATSGAREDLGLYVAFAGAVPDAPDSAQSWTDWDQPATREWTARAVWQALNAPNGASR